MKKRLAKHLNTNGPVNCTRWKVWLAGVSLISPSCEVGRNQVTCCKLCATQAQSHHDALSTWTMTEWHLGPRQWDSCKGLCSYHSYFSPQRKLSRASSRIPAHGKLILRAFSSPLLRIHWVYFFLMSEGHCRKLQMREWQSSQPKVSVLLGNQGEQEIGKFVANVCLKSLEGCYDVWPTTFQAIH